MLESLFIVELLLMLAIATKRGVISTAFIVFVVFFFYGQAFYIDYLISGLKVIEVSGIGILRINDDNYVYISILYFFFLLTFSIIVLVKKSVKPIAEVKREVVCNKQYMQLLYVGIALIAIYSIGNLTLLTRYEKIEFLGANKIITTLLSCAMLGGIIMQLKKKIFSNKDYLSLVLTIFIVVYGLVEGGRELFVYTGLLVLYFRAGYKIKPLHVILVIFALFLVTIWKPFSIYVVLLDDFDAFVDYMSHKYVFRLTDIDPKASILLLSEYFNNNIVFDDLKYSYYVNTVSQFFSAIGLMEYQSIGRRIVAYFNSDRYFDGGGFAFSGILESVLNFSYAGPIILGIVLGKISNYIEKYKAKCHFHYALFSIFFIILAMKLVRTELAVVLKIYLLPMIVAYYVFYKFSLKRIN